ncbi:helix-turn-helix transcriptional regulator [Desulfitobacterium metallireducens]|uniref:DNA-binding protein n=1 Tax=Desulfitobacterium metallireducens DSM 15288 TaxID=871968 RepID=W0E835_9FIRM|nr:helix-turn-helix transcriptional regulator [Desulfitobacterium metallireducens]AHF07030.1 DNA-binding protein [Desulfitobacterium metallireducens DSM 15288]
MESSAMYHGNKVRTLRLHAGIATQKELANRAKISPTIISDLERGRRELNPSWAMRIAEAVGTSWQNLFEEEVE